MATLSKIRHSLLWFNTMALAVVAVLLAFPRTSVHLDQALLGFIALILIINIVLIFRHHDLTEAAGKNLKLSQIMENSLNEIYTFDALNLRFLEVNKTARDNLGYSLKEMQDLTPLSIKPDLAPSDFATLVKPLENGLQEIVHFTTMHQRKDGSVYPVDVHLRLNTGNSPTFLAIILDVSQSKKAEKDLKQSENKLKEAQAIAQLGHWELNLVQDELKWSDEIYRIFDLEPQQFEATYEAFLGNIHPDDRDMVNNAYSQSLKDMKPYEITHRLLLRDGTIKYVEEKCITEFDDQGAPLFSTGTVLDITKHVLAEKELHKYRLQLEEMVETRTSELKVANKDLVDFAYSVSHDLKAPLRAISGFSEIISRRHRHTLNEESQRYFDHILNAAISMNQLIEDLLKYSRLGRQAVQIQPVDLNDVFSIMETTFDRQVKELGATLNFPENSPVIPGNHTLLIQIFTNLIDNALSYRRVGIAPIVAVLCRVENNQAIISINDNGLGIAPEFHEKVFHIFQRLHSEAEKPGTGIGLAIVRKSTAILGGSVKLESTPGEGCSFQVTLPMAKQESKNEKTSNNFIG